jgi:hypothetical protein
LDSTIVTKGEQFETLLQKEHSKNEMRLYLKIKGKITKSDFNATYMPQKNMQMKLTVNMTQASVTATWKHSSNNTNRYLLGLDLHVNQKNYLECRIYVLARAQHMFG